MYVLPDPGALCRSDTSLSVDTARQAKKQEKSRC